MENTYRLKEKLEDLWCEIGRAEELLKDLESGKIPQREVLHEQSLQSSQGCNASIKMDGSQD